MWERLENGQYMPLTVEWYHRVMGTLSNCNAEVLTIHSAKQSWILSRHSGDVCSELFVLIYLALGLHLRSNSMSSCPKTPGCQPLIFSNLYPSGQEVVLLLRIRRARTHEPETTQSTLRAAFDLRLPICTHTIRS